MPHQQAMTRIPSTSPNLNDLAPFGDPPASDLVAVSSGSTAVPDLAAIASDSRAAPGLGDQITKNLSGHNDPPVPDDHLDDAEMHNVAVAVADENASNNDDSAVSSTDPVPSKILDGGQSQQDQPS
ncbi:hypothetical protein Droror1_Dr00022318 [Drosera rotundifolia]